MKIIDPISCFDATLLTHPLHSAMGQAEYEKKNNHNNNVIILKITKLQLHTVISCTMYYKPLTVNNGIQAYKVVLEFREKNCK